MNDYWSHGVAGSTVTRFNRGMAKLTAKSVKQRLQSLADPKAAAGAMKFFKTGPGQYGEGDVFIGINTPTMRKVATESIGLPLPEVLVLLKSPIHEHRTVALMIMAMQFDRGDEAIHKQIYAAYLAHTRWVNNWDLVDTSAYQIAGRWLENRNRQPLYRLAKSKSVWERRIAIVGTFRFIRQNDFQPTFEIAELLMSDKHDLIHKAVGWMLREVYKRNPVAAIAFLEKYQHALPRTSLRYAIERCDEKTRKRLMLRSK